MNYCEHLPYHQGWAASISPPASLCPRLEREGINIILVLPPLFVLPSPIVSKVDGGLTCLLRPESLALKRDFLCQLLPLPSSMMDAPAFGVDCWDLLQIKGN